MSLYEVNAFFIKKYAVSIENNYDIMSQTISQRKKMLPNFYVTGSIGAF
jgi:hypothetical protein